jgi:hypothetical protein
MTEENLLLSVDVAKYIGEVDPWRVFVAGWSLIVRRWPKRIRVPPVSVQWLDDHAQRAARRGDLP